MNGFTLNGYSAGVLQALNTATILDKQIIKQKFYDLGESDKSGADGKPIKYKINDFVNVISNQFSYQNEYAKWLSFDVAGKGGDGFMLDNVEFTRAPAVKTVRTMKKWKRIYWAKKVTYNEFELKRFEALLKNGNVAGNFIEEDLTARKRNWDLEKQRNVFLGNKAVEGLTGLLNNDEISKQINTLYNKSIIDMTEAEFENFRLGLPKEAYSLSNYTSAPNTLLMSTKEKINLLTITSAATPNKTRYDLLLESLQKTCGGSFKIIATPYCDKNYNDLGYDIMMLYRNDKDTLIYDDALSFYTTPFRPFDDGFMNIAYAGAGCVQVYRPQECIYYIKN